MPRRVDLTPVDDRLREHCAEKALFEAFRETDADLDAHFVSQFPNESHGDAVAMVAKSFASWYTRKVRYYFDHGRWTIAECVLRKRS